MNRPAFELADIVRQHGAAYRQAHSLSYQQLRVLRAIEICRTAALGGHVEQCSQCEHWHIAYNSCRNRHCPKCQNTARRQWVEDRKDELLPAEYFHVVFTLPQQAAEIAFQNQTAVYKLLFQAASQTLLTLGRDPKHLGGEIGFFAILHTWGQNLLHHPHLHCVVPGGALSPDRERWLACRPGFVFPVRVLSTLFRRLFLEGLQQAFDRNELRFFGELTRLQSPAAFTELRSQLGGRDWVVYAKRPFGGPAQVLEYLGRYTHRVAIANERLLKIDKRDVTFQWKDYRSKDRYKSRVMTLTADEFLRRFLMHCLPPGFQRIRYFGFLANRHRKDKLALCRCLLTDAVAELLPSAVQCNAILPALPKNPNAICPVCSKGVMIRIGILPVYRWPAKPLDSS